MAKWSKHEKYEILNLDKLDETKINLDDSSEDNYRDYTTMKTKQN